MVCVEFELGARWIQMFQIQMFQSERERRSQIPNRTIHLTLSNAINCPIPPAPLNTSEYVPLRCLFRIIDWFAQEDYFTWFLPFTHQWKCWNKTSLIIINKLNRWINWMIEIIKIDCSLCELVVMLVCMIEIHVKSPCWALVGRMNGLDESAVWQFVSENYDKVRRPECADTNPRPLPLDLIY